MRRFEFQEGGSNKFWEIELDGSGFTVRWGKLGTTGQTQAKSFADSATAVKEHDKLVAEKRKKGYVEVGAPVLVASAVVAAQAPAPQVSPRSGGTEGGRMTRVTAPPATGALQWTDGLKRKILAWRTQPARPTPDLKKVLARLQEVRDLDALKRGFAKPKVDMPKEFQPALLRRIEAPLAQPPALVPEVEAAFLCLMGHNDHAWDRCHEIGSDMVHLWCSQAPVTLAVQALILNYPYQEGGQKTESEQRGYFPYMGPWRTLRGYLSVAEPSVYTAALELARPTMQTGAPRLRRMLALAFPDEVEFTNEVASEALQSNPCFHDIGLLASLTDGELFRSLAEKLHPFLGNDFLGFKAFDYLPTSLARMKAAAVPGLLIFAENVKKTAERKALAELLAAVPDHPDILAFMQKNKHDRAVGPAASLYLDKPQPAATMPPSPAASSADLPELLANPPWTRPAPKKKIPKMSLEPLEHTEILHMPEKTRQELLNRNSPCTQEEFKKWTKDFPENSPWLKFAERLCDLCDLEWAVRAWNTTPPKRWNIYSFRGEWDRTPERLLATFGTAALPGLINIAALAQDNTYPALALVESARLAPIFAELRAGKKFRNLAQKWLKSYPEAAAVGLIPAALGGNAKAGDALRWLAGQGHEATILKTAERYAVRAPVSELLSFDPLFELPSKIPALPAWLRPERLEAPKLNTGQALPPEAVGHVCTMLALSKLDAPYAGLERLREMCDAASLERFALSLFDAWLVAGGPAKEDWGFLVLGYFGGDQAARRLAPELRRWPGEGLSSRAGLGLDVLGSIGTDVAMMHLHAISLKVRFKALQDKAEAKIQSIAEERGMSVDELADRLVPDLDLDEDGSRRLGSCTVTFDEHLVPQLRDEQGKPLKDLPKSAPPEAVEAWKALKKDARAVAATQLERLEQGLARRRRWDPQTFELLLVRHPLLGHLVRRLIWGVYENDQVVASFRVAEDRTYADPQDRPFRISGSSIGLVHPLEHDLSEWARVLGDYNILQPFEQLGRPVRKGPAQFENKVAKAGRILRLERRGWKRGEIESGCVLQFVKRLSQGQAVLEIQEGGHVEVIGREDSVLGRLELPEGAHAIDVSETLADIEAVLA